MEKLILTIKHTLNPLHVYCRLVDSGLGARASRRVGMAYEKMVHPALLALATNSASLLERKARNAKSPPAGPSPGEKEGPTPDP